MSDCDVCLVMRASAGMEPCNLSTSAPSTSMFLKPCMRYSTEELCAALRSTSLAHPSGQPGPPAEAQTAASGSNSSSSGFSATASGSATTCRSSSSQCSGEGGSNSGLWVAQARPFGTASQVLQQQQQQQQQQQESSSNGAEAEPIRSTAAPSSGSLSPAAAAAAAAAFANLLQPSARQSQQHPWGTSLALGAHPSTALQSAPISSLATPQTRAMVRKVASFAASSGGRGSTLPRVSEELPPPPPCSTSRSSSAGAEPAHSLPACPDEGSSTWNTTKGAHATGESMEGEDGMLLGAETGGEEPDPMWIPSVPHLLEPKPKEVLSPTCLESAQTNHTSNSAPLSCSHLMGVSTDGAQMCSCAQAGDTGIDDVRADEELDPMSLSVASLAEEARCMSPQPLLPRHPSDFQQHPNCQGASSMVMCRSQCSMQLDDSADEPPPPPPPQQQQQHHHHHHQLPEVGHTHTLHSLQHQLHQQEALQLQQQQHAQCHQQQQEAALHAPLHPG
ncbi:hypothetical protein DUNSADRAFT_8459 [Dunaliella salina]|uniref:Encoded protein n=1 Tax=Dunaliella salina TaxID=3046 RepID=A0ABQ7GJH5_DUNSA|nr:hypothetical protein DUNSADRAFT_8459 [Dunaliella salina]|eukprot:KAF5834771.1 hypothetical protein DUNSADRAFT_8459 [Dunaliella salina]